MRFGKIFLAVVAAGSLLSAPVMAQSLSPAAKAAETSKVKRAGASAKDESKLRGGFIIPIIAVAAVILGIIVVTRNDDDKPKSP